MIRNNLTYKKSKNKKKNRFMADLADFIVLLALFTITVICSVQLYGGFLTFMEKKDIAKIIDHTLLSPDAKEDDILRLCSEAKEHGFASCCVNPYYVPLCAELLKNSGVSVCTVVGFPLGACSAEDKAQQASICVKQGADEVDMVINIGAAKDGNWNQVLSEISAVRKAVDSVFPHKKIILKVILETCLLLPQEIVTACQKAMEGGADFVKTSTGFSTSGASVEAVSLMRRTVGTSLGVKASGGIHSFEEAVSMVNAGATRLGCSASLKIIK